MADQENEFEHVFARAQRRDPDFDHTSVNYFDVRARQLEGHFPGDNTLGTWPITVARIAFGWGTVPESAWPYSAKKEDWPPLEPSGLDELAKTTRTWWYQRIRGPESCARMIGNLLPPSCAFEIFEQWYNAKDGVIELPQGEETAVGSHSVGFMGLDVDHLALYFENSWGADWGHRGAGVMSFDYFK